MHMHFKKLVLVGSVALALSACSSDSDDNDSGVNSTIEALGISCVEVTEADSETVASSLALEVVGTYESGNEFATSSAEIVSYDSCTDSLYVVNAEDQSVDVLALDSTDSTPTKSGVIDLSAAATQAGISIGSANSVVAKNGVIAVAIENEDKQSDGIIALYRSDTLALINTYTAGALPDMVAMTDDSRYLLTANEGEPSSDYSVDPEGTVTIVDLDAGTDDGEAVVTQVRFTDFNEGGSKADSLTDVRLPAPFDASVAQDLEPEYLAITSDDKVIVSLQENNAFATIDIATAEVESINGLGTKSWASVADGGDGAVLDLTNKDEVFSQASYPQLVGYYMPDTIAAVTINGTDYIISANEGDGREYIYETTQSVCDAAGHDWDGDDYAPGGDDEDADAYLSDEDDCLAYTDEGRGEDLNVDDAHPLMDESVYGDETIANDDAIGRIKVIMDDEDVAADENVYTFGARSFSIWDLDANRVYDSGNDLSDRANTANYWNVSNDTNENDNRSDDKGVEPEAVEVAEIAGMTVAFIGLERQGGIAAYDISTPTAPVFLDYINNRDFTVDVCTEVDDGECDNDTYNSAAGDLGPESIEYFSRLGQHYIAVGNEVSGTTTVYLIDLD
jgi:hypothetical protein